MCETVFTSADGCQRWTLGSKAGAGGVVVMVTVGMAPVLGVTACPLGKWGWGFRGEEGRWGR